MLPKALIAATLKPIMLSILSEGEAYGYHIIQRTQDLSNGKIRWTAGTLYPMLHRLETDGLVVSCWREATNAPKRKYYQLTPKGYKALEYEKRQWIDANKILARLWGSELELSLS